VRVIACCLRGSRPGGAGRPADERVCDGSYRDRASKLRVVPVQRTRKDAIVVGLPSICSEAREGSTMARAKQASKRKRSKTALPAWGAAGMSLAMAGGASAAVAPTANAPSQPTELLPMVTLDEEEISDVSLATFYVFDREGLDTPWLGERIAARGGCRGCGRCGGAARCGGRCAAVARCGGRCAAVARCGGRCAAVARCARCGCSCSGCSAPCWTWFPTGWVFVC
jgi:hypothetical protein